MESEEQKPRATEAVAPAWPEEWDGAWCYSLGPRVALVLWPSERPDAIDWLEGIVFDLGADATKAGPIAKRWPPDRADVCPRRAAVARVECGTRALPALERIHLREAAEEPGAIGGRSCRHWRSRGLDF